MCPVWDVAACPHGTYFVSAGADQTARLWSTEVARPLRIFNGGLHVPAGKPCDDLAERSLVCLYPSNLA